MAKRVLESGGTAAAQLRVAEQYVKEFGNIAKKGNVVVMTSDVADVSSMVAKSMAVFQQMNLNPPPSNQNLGDNSEAEESESSITALSSSSSSFDHSEKSSSNISGSSSTESDSGKNQQFPGVQSVRELTQGKTSSVDRPS